MIKTADELLRAIERHRRERIGNTFEPITPADFELWHELDVKAGPTALPDAQTTCSVCFGHGRWWQAPLPGITNTVGIWMTCSHCNGRGTVDAVVHGD